MKALLCACVAGLLVGCGASGGAVHSASSLEVQRAQAAELRGLRKRNAEQESKLQELETQLALAQAGLNQLQAAKDREDMFKHETVRIGGDSARADPDPAAPPVDPDPPSAGEDDGPRPVLRLYGRRPPASDASADAPTPQVPAGLPPQLPVAPLPDAQVPAPALLASAQSAAPAQSAPSAQLPQIATQPDAVQQTPTPEDPGVEAYRMALTLVHDRQFEQAEQAFRSFLDRYPSHPYANHARYWLGEVLYAERKYPEALETFSQVAQQTVERDRAAEAFLKMGLCEKRMGRPDQAHALFEKVRKEYPGSVAARLASEEEAS